MKRLLAIVFLAGCAGSLVDHDSLTSGGGPPTQACIDTCKSAPAGAKPRCRGDVCDFECTGGKLKADGGCVDATAIAVGRGHSCAIAGGAVRCWGGNDQFQLGRTGLSSYIPSKVEGITGTLTAIAAGATHTCAIAGGDVWCWGENASGQLGSGAIDAGGPTPRRVTTSAGAVQLAAGGAHTCYADTTQVFCWGSNVHGEVGNGAPVLPAPSQTSPTAVANLTSPLAIAAGDSHTCAIATGGVWCWGLNGAGQLGIHSGTSESSTAKQTSLTAASFIGLGANHSCATDPSGALFCWGANSSAQIDGSRLDQPDPKGVLSGVGAVAGGIGHTCTLRRSDVACWGLNDKGQVSGGGAGGPNPVDVGLTTAQAVAASYKHTCAIDGGAVKCWGLNDQGQLGTDTGLGSSSTPVEVSGR